MRVRRILGFAGVALIACWSLLHPIGAAANSRHKLVFFEHSMETAAVDHEPSGLSLGDTLTLRGRLMRSAQVHPHSPLDRSPIHPGEVRGTFEIVCTVTNLEEGQQSCLHSWTLPRGTIEGQASIPAQLNIGSTFVGALTGGTGKYDNARGHVTIEILSPTVSKATLHLAR